MFTLNIISLMFIMFTLNIISLMFTLVHVHLFSIVFYLRTLIGRLLALGGYGSLWVIPVFSTTVLFYKM